MWGAWARELGRRLEATTGQPLASEVFAAIGFDPTTGRVAARGPLAIAPEPRLREIVEAVVRRYCPSVAAARRAVEGAWFAPDPVALAQPLADLPGLFGALRAAGRRIAVATTDDREPTERTLEALGVRALVDALACADDGGPTKPDPAVVLELCRRLGVEPARTALVSDAPDDLAMARRAGLGLVVGVTSGTGTRDELEPLADLVLGSVAELA